MVFWETEEATEGQPEPMRDYAEIWRAADKVVYSTSLEEVSTARTRIERSFDPEAVRELKDSASSDVSVGGAGLAAAAFAAGLVDECQLFLVPVSIGAGKRALPGDLRVDLELLDERRFEGGTVHLHYRVRN